MYVKIILKIIYKKSKFTYSLQIFNVYDKDICGIENTHDLYIG